MSKPIQIQVPTAFQADLIISDRIPINSRCYLAFAQQQYWKHPDFSIIEQYCNTENIHIYLAEVNTKVPIDITVIANRPNLYWLYQLENSYTLLSDYKKRKSILETTEQTFNVIYLPVGRYWASFKEGSNLIFYYVVRESLLLRLQDTSLKHLKNLLEKLEKRHVEFAFTIKLPINSRTQRYLNLLFNLPKLDSLELENEVPYFILKLVALARQEYRNKIASIQVNVPKLEQVRAYAEEMIHKGIILSPQEIAEQFSITPHHLRQAHKQAYNESLQRFITALRLHEAYRLIDEEKLRPTEAAYAMGYYDSNALAKPFIKQFGISPNDLYRK